jgi:phenylalanyl-tRNA synthetase beta chain
MLNVPHRSPEKLASSLFKNGMVVNGYRNGQPPLVKFGEVNTILLKGMDIKQVVYYVEFNWDLILEQMPKSPISHAALPKYPSVRRDLALVLDKQVEYISLKESSFKAEKQLLQEVNIFDVYEGKGIPEGKKSYALSFTFRDKNRTLTDAEIDKSMQKLMDLFKQEFNAEIRS